MTELEHLLEQYDYPLEKDWIADKPAEPRDSSKLLIYDRKGGSTRFDTFLNLANYLPCGALLVINDTKVIPARLYGRIKTGGKVEVFVTNVLADGTIEALVNRRMEAGDNITIAEDVVATVVSKHESVYRLTLKTDKPLETILQEHGTTPIPPYLKHTPLTEEELRERYQAIFAKNPGSVAAPTASLHFTDRLLEKLRQKSVEMAYVTLHVNLGTFAPLTANALATGQLHAERYSIPKKTAEAITRAKTEGRPIIPIGTTALRTIESATDEEGAITRPSGDTSLFIREGYRFKCADGLVTNFHVPHSSLLMLVAALVGREKILELYAAAHERGFRFLSFGDGMLIL